MNKNIRQIPYTDIQIISDPRMPIVNKMVKDILGIVDARDTIVVVMPDNNMITICKFTTINVYNLKECIPDFAMYIDPVTFQDEYIDLYKLKEDEYVLFNQDTASIYLNVMNTIQDYFYNLNQYVLVDKIEDLTSYEDFQYYMNLKADQGSKFFRGYSNLFVAPIITKFPNIAKNDKASIYVYNIDPLSNLIVWKVWKKKYNRDLYTIYRVMNFNQSK